MTVKKPIQNAVEMPENNGWTPRLGDTVWKRSTPKASSTNSPKVRRWCRLGRYGGARAYTNRSRAAKARNARSAWAGARL
ncbi:MAG: hypothetical protein U0694_16725 [Anaerolineae bacterium]